MSNESTNQPDRPGQYEVRLKGHLEPRWAAWFDGMALTHGSDGTTTIHGPVADQAALFGLLLKLRDTGLPLVSVTEITVTEITVTTQPPTEGD